MALVLDGESAAACYEMPPEREGDFIAVADRYTAIGSRPDEHDLAGLTGHRLRSHGGGCGHRKSSATCDSSASAGGGHSVKASTGPADQCRHDVAMAIAHIAHAGRLAADGELHGGPSTVRVAPVGARRSSWNC